MAVKDKVADVPVTCMGKCGLVANATMWQCDDPGVIAALPPDGWLINADGICLIFCCEQCAARLGLRCSCSGKTRKHAH